MLGLGTVVILEKKDKTLMDHKVVIVDRYLFETKNSKEYFQYKGVVHPFVSYKEGGGVLFNDEHVGQVIFEGYFDLKDESFCQAMEEKFEELDISKAKRGYVVKSEK